MNIYDVAPIGIFLPIAIVIVLFFLGVGLIALALFVAMKTVQRKNKKRDEKSLKQDSESTKEEENRE